MAKVLSVALFKIVNLVALMGYLFNIISMFSGGGSYCGTEEYFTYQDYNPTYYEPSPTYYEYTPTYSDYDSYQPLPPLPTIRPIVPHSAYVDYQSSSPPLKIMHQHDKPTEAGSIVNGVFHVFSFLALLYIEVDQSPAISSVVPFLFSFAGRGVFFMWLAWSTFTVSIISLIGSIITFIVGVIYLFLFILKNSKTPQHMSFDDTLFSGVSKFFADSSDEGESFLPTHKSTSADIQQLNAASSVV